LLATIIGQGTSEGIFTIAEPNAAGRVVVSLIQDLNDRLAELTMAHWQSGGDFAQVEQTVAAYTDALQRILAAPTASVQLVDTEALRLWFNATP
jgi:hypothetical protein